MALDRGMRTFMEERFFKIVSSDALGRVVGVYDKEMTLVVRKSGRVRAAFVHNDMADVHAIEGR